MQGFAWASIIASVPLLLSCSDPNPTKFDDASAGLVQKTFYRSTEPVCEISANSLVSARQEFLAYCGSPPRDCDPIAGQWRCSSEVIGKYAPPVHTSHCAVRGSSLGSAISNYERSCQLPRRDCDPVRDHWVCSSQQIGKNAPPLQAQHTSPAFLMGLSLTEQWNELGLAAVRDGLARPTATTHQMFQLSAAMYDAIAMYNSVAAPYALSDHYRRPVNEHTRDNKKRAASQAAYQTLKVIFADYEAQTGHFNQHLRALGYRDASRGNHNHQASRIGYQAAMAVLRVRSNDGSNANNDYEETTSNRYPERYVPTNLPGAIDQINELGEQFDPNRWQPLRVPTGALLDSLSVPVIDELNLDTFGDQGFLSAHWGAVTPFALANSAEYRPSAPPRYNSIAEYTDARGQSSSSHQAYVQQVGEVLDYSANLTDRHKVIAEFWADGPRTESPPGHWNQLAHGIIERDDMDIDEATRLFFVLNGALLDAGIATWEAKRYYDFIRPASAIRFLYNGELIQAWGGPNMGTQPILGENWSPYQKLTFVTPPFPEYVSGHSTFSRAAADVLTYYTGSNIFYDGVTMTTQDVNGDGMLDMLGEHIATAGSFFIEPGPSNNIVLQWKTFRDASDEAGISRLYGGIHIQDGDLRGRELGAKIGERAFAKAQQYFNGTVE